MVRAFASLAVCLSTAVYGQSAAGKRFEVASIKPSNSAPSASSGITTGHGRLDAHNVTLKRCIMGAYSVGPHQISGGPDWLDSDRFEILAKADQPIDDDAALMVMLQSLLAERFKLVLHQESKTITALVLEVAKNGPKLEKAAAGEASTNTSTDKTSVTIDAQNTDMDLFAQILARRTELPVVNHTELAGIFNFKLHWTPESAKPADGAAMEGPSLFTAIQEQLGLRLRSQKAPVEALVIDHVEKPSGN
jgi:uncharacterized protein (TIGR03435 family)